MQIPKSPSWKAVFLFGAAYNAVVAQCWWAVVFCVAVVISLPALHRADVALIRALSPRRRPPNQW